MFSRLFSFFKHSAKEYEPMWILVGLGNPGKEYQDNRHNIGFLAIDEIASEYSLPPFNKKSMGRWR